MTIADPQPPTPSPRQWSVGTLSYTRGQLIQVFFWMLLGDFCLHLMDNGVVPTLVPLQLESYGASKWLIGLIYGTLINVMYFFLTPIVSTASDRHRSRLGRRVPFLLFATPFLAIALILLGFSHHIAKLSQLWFPALLGNYSTMNIALVLACVFFLLVKFFDMFPQSVYYYMWADVIPPELMGTFGALFRVFYALGSFVFNKFLIGLAKEHPEEIYMASAGMYLVAFLLLCWRVKEGKYPPPEQVSRADGSRVQRFTDAARVYLRECFSHSFWWKYFLMSAAFQAGYQPFIANIVFFGKEIYGGDETGLRNYGSVMATKDLIWIGIYFVLVFVMRWVHPLKAAVLGYVLMTVTALLGFVLIRSPETFSLFTILTFITVAVYLGGTAAMNARILPREQFGQFASAGAMVFRISIAVAAVAMGLVLDWTHSNRYVFLWMFVFQAIGTVLGISVFFDWKNLGGERSYRPPTAMTNDKTRMTNQ